MTSRSNLLIFPAAACFVGILGAAMGVDYGSGVNRSVASEGSPMAGINRCIQSRFRTLRKFGMGRVPVVPQHVQWFAPETAAEKSAVQQLQRQGWKAALYLGGRELLRRRLTPAEWHAAGDLSFLRAISQPILLADNAPTSKRVALKFAAQEQAKRLTGLPQPWELWDQGRQGLTAPQDSGDRGAVGNWSVDVRPIRATQQACLSCHQGDGISDQNRDQKGSLHVGEPLGVAIYVYQREPQP